jgi:hypothetical protein
MESLIKHIILFIGITGTTYNTLLMGLWGIKYYLSNKQEDGYTAYKYYLLSLFFGLILGLSLYSGFKFQY